MTKYKKSAGTIIYCNDKGKIKFLLMRNTLKNTYWEFPKGKIEENEKLRETAEREAREETKLKNFEYLPDFKHSQQWYFRFKGETINKTAIYLIARIPSEDMDKVDINKEHEDFDWLTYKEALDRISIKNNKKMLKKAYKKIKEYEKQKKLFN